MDSLSNDLFQVLRNVLTQLPSLITLLVCLGVALFRWKRHSKVSLVASLAFVSLILHGVVFSAAYVLIPRWVFGPDSSAPHPTFYTWLAIVTNILFAIALAVLLVAIFIDRSNRSATPKLT